jgi:hypothetical protein
MFNSFLSFRLLDDPIIILILQEVFNIHNLIGLYVLIVLGVHPVVKQLFVGLSVYERINGLRVFVFVADLHRVCFDYLNID